MHFFTQSSSSFRSTCPYQRSLFCCNINAMSSTPENDHPVLKQYQSLCTAGVSQLSTVESIIIGGLIIINGRLATRLIEAATCN